MQQRFPQKLSLCFVEDFISIISNDNRVSYYADYLTDMFISENTVFLKLI